jgi:hypothetical protein
LIRQHGDKADPEAAKLHADMLVEDDGDGAQVWSRIRRAIIARPHSLASCVTVPPISPAMVTEAVGTP